MPHGTDSKALRSHCSRNPDFAHPVLMIIRNCSLIRGSYIGCRSPMIMSNHTLLTCGIRAGEQRDLAGVPDDHEQSGAVVMGAGAGDPG